MPSWKPEVFFPISPTLLYDSISWPFAMALASLALAVILTDVARAWEADWLAWAGTLVVAALGIAAVAAGNPLTLVLAWTALDLAELVILLVQIQSSRGRERVIISFASRAAGIILLLLSMLIAESTGEPLNFDSIPPASSLFLLLAAALRLGVLPMHTPFLEELPLRRGLGTILRLAPVASSLMLLTRAASSGIPENLQSPLLAFSSLAALFAGITWLTAQNELDGRPFWILAMSALAVGCAVLGFPQAVTAWGVAALLSGGMIFLFSTRHRAILPAAALSLFGISGLPYTPAWQGVLLYTPPLSVYSILFLLTQAALMTGFILHSGRQGPPLSGVERWVWVIYPAGILLLPLTQILIFLWSIRLSAQGGALPDLIASWPALIPLVFLVLSGLFGRRLIQLIPGRMAAKELRSVLSFAWLYSLLWGVYHFFRRSSALVNQTLEGEGGILWTLLILILILSLLVQTA
jgi:hypothetical protein